MATQTVDITDTAGINFAVVKGAALVGNEDALAVRAIISPANFALGLSQFAISTATAPAPKISNGMPSANRRLVRIKNGTAFILYIGNDNTVTAASGYAIFPGEVESIELGPGKDIYGTGSAGATGQLYVMELG
jgi:hypothetical protein